MKNVNVGDLQAGGIVAAIIEDGKGLVVAQSDLRIMRWEDASNFNQELNGFNDWRLPTKDELIVLRKNKKILGGFTEGDYWSGTLSNDEGCAWAQSFEEGSEFQFDTHMSNGLCVRLVRESVIQ